MEALSRHTENGLKITSLERPGCRDYYIALQPEAGFDFQRACARLADTVRGLGASLVALDVFGVPGTADTVLRKAFDRVPCPPITWMEGRRNHDAPFYGLLAWAVNGPEVVPVQAGNGAAGVAFRVDGVRYCRLGGVTAPDRSASRREQTREVFNGMERALAQVDMNFTNVVRTWFYNSDMLDWYDVFNEVRTGFFLERRLFDRLVPASTGIGCWNGRQAALTAGLLAVGNGEKNVTPVEVPSPLQRPSFEYGSAFSRAVEFAEGGLRRLFISGTASIEPGGSSVHIGDVRAQIQLTLDVVQAILASRGMDWGSASRSVAYFKHAQDASALQECMDERGMPPLPGILAHTDICRDDLLFELELDAVSAE